MWKWHLEEGWQLTCEENVPKILQKSIRGTFNTTKINLVIKALFSSTDLGVYQAIKRHFGMEKYLMDIKCKKAMVVLTAFRCSAHTLEIKRGKFCSPKIPREFRLCNWCREKGVNEIEDEFHMLMKCNHFDMQREDLFNKVGIHTPNFAFLGNHQNVFTC